MNTFVKTAIVSGVLFSFWGCNQGPKLYDIEGNVTFEDAPLPEGGIIFMPVDKTLPPEQGTIAQGSFKMKVREGKHRVEISASKILPGGAKGAGGEPVAEEYIPTKYNFESTLTADISPSGNNKFDFKLKSK